MKPLKKETHHMSNDARIAVLETTIVNINSTLLDIRQDIKVLSNKTSHDIKDLSDKTSRDIKDLSDKTSRDIKDLSDKTSRDIKDLSDKTSHDMKDLLNTMTLMMRESSDKIFQSIKDLSNKIDKLENRLWTNFFWLMGMIIGLTGLVAHTQDWI
jgi:hypothetical protein